MQELALSSLLTNDNLNISVMARRKEQREQDYLSKQWCYGSPTSNILIEQYNQLLANKRPSLVIFYPDTI